MTCEVRVIADSIHNNKRITTLQLRYWRAIHSELMTHRVFSRNASSSRAIPVKTTLKQVWNEPAGPIHWGANQAGMQAHSQLTGWRLKLAKLGWKLAGRTACIFAWSLMKVGLHKQVANRLLEPWQYISVVLTSTEWDNFFALRCHKDAQPEFQELATAIRGAMQNSLPRERPETGVDAWHLPYITAEERKTHAIHLLCKMSAARCARVSYLRHDGTSSTLEEDVALFERLVGSKPAHSSPVEHQARPAEHPELTSGNFVGWLQWRQTM